MLCWRNIPARHQFFCKPNHDPLTQKILSKPVWEKSGACFTKGLWPIEWFPFYKSSVIGRRVFFELEKSLVAHSLSAKKRIRQNLKNRARNRARKIDIRTDVGALNAAFAAGDVAKATEHLNKTVKTLDRVAARGTIHKKTAARRRSRLTKRLNALKATKK
jgi:small subunit ribosomal protein S20